MCETCPLYGQQKAWDKLNRLLESGTHGNHIFIVGSQGSGKTKMAKNFLKLYARKYNYNNWESWGESSNDDCLLLTSDQDRGIQTIRSIVSLFVRQIGTAQPDGSSRHRWLVVDDCDMLPHISQQALRRPMECYSHITRFLFIGNSVEDLIPAIQSRCIIIKLQPVNFFEQQAQIFKDISMPYETDFTVEMFYTIVNISNNNFADILRYLYLIRNYCASYKVKPSIQIINRLCSVPFYNLFLPLMNSICSLELEKTISILVKIWKKGYTFEDILDNLNQIYILYGTPTVRNNFILKTFQINAWVDYCKGNTSIVAMQNVTCRTFSELESLLKNSDIFNEKNLISE